MVSTGPVFGLSGAVSGMSNLNASNTA
jgi:hypothetical protein